MNVGILIANNVTWLKLALKHYTNFAPTILLMAGTCMALHYSLLQQRLNVVTFVRQCVNVGILIAINKLSVAASIQPARVVANEHKP